jgi:hypothetical protein
MRIKSYHIAITLITLLILFLASCNYLKPVQGNGRITKTDKELSSEFNTVEIDGAFDLFLSQGSVPQLSIETDENLVQYIDAKVKNHKLIIKNKRNIGPSNDINIYLTINTIKQMNLAGAVVVKSTGKINFDSFGMKLFGASNVTMDMNCVDLKLECNGSTTLRLSGAASDATIGVDGACDIANDQLIVDNMKLDVEGGAKVKVNVLTKLDVKVNGAAEVNYLGSPEVHKEIKGAGSVEKIF